MDSEKLMLSRDNPRTLAFPATKAMPNDLAQKLPPTPILDRYRALLKQRDDDLRVSPMDDVSPPQHRANCATLRDGLVGAHIQFEAHHYRSHYHRRRAERPRQGHRRHNLRTDSRGPS